MFFIPFPLVIAEFIIFWMAVQQWGFLNTLGLYLLPCVLGMFIMNVVGRIAIMGLQGQAMSGQIPANKMLHSGAIFVSGLLFLIPSFFSRVLAVILLLPGLRHLAVWWFKIYLAKKIAQGTAQAFNFGSGGPFGFGAGSAGFKYYDFNQQNGGFQNSGNMKDVEGFTEEREVSEANILDIKPLEVSHKDNKE
jgi:UPF0716 protein FxsA